MPTDIYFGGENLRVRVDEDPHQITEAFTSAHGVPLRLTSEGGRGDIYVNPAMVAFWAASDATPEPEPREEARQPVLPGDDVTDIWGQPLRTKRRR